MADDTYKCPTLLKKVSFVFIQGIRWADFLRIQCGLIAIRLAYDVLLLLVKVECLLTSTDFSNENVNEHLSSGHK